MKKAFELQINGKFIQHLKPSEVHLLKWEKDYTFTLTPVLLTKEQYSRIFNI